MKNITKLFGIIAFAVIIGFTMVGCDTGSSPSSTPPPPPPPVATTGTLVLNNTSMAANDIIEIVDIFSGTSATGTAIVRNLTPISMGQSRSWTLQQGEYFMRVQYNDRTFDSIGFSIFAGGTVTINSTLAGLRRL